ncbi:MAG: hypothetical protein KatS3mg099_305 [Candidatus Parcubacteria bacterium]|nr:MAG: hypothetical protein KatS3mg099_305 [Candidatus Parcubacteria bacterium]
MPGAAETLRGSTASAADDRHTLWAAYLTQFFVSFHLFSVLYIASSYLASLLGEAAVSWVVGAGAFAAFAGVILLAARLARRVRVFSEYLGWWAAVEAVLYGALWLADAVTPSLGVALVVAGAFIATQLTYLLGVYGVDLAFESVIGARENITGRVRTTALTLMNAALVAAAALSPWVVEVWGYGAAYFLGILALIPALWFGRLLKVPIAPSHTEPFTRALALVAKHKPLHDAYLLQIGLRMFYAWMVIYTPLYLHFTLGFSWQELALPFVVMLLPFVLFERIVGWLADTRWGERELIIVGFVIMGASVALFPLLTSAPLWVWAAVLFVSRTGAALVEAATESYFFKHINTNGGVVVAFFRSTRPAAFLLASITGGAVSAANGIGATFAMLAATMIMFAIRAFSLRDTQPE